jgi:hypothetical protein
MPAFHPFRTLQNGLREVARPFASQNDRLSISRSSWPGMGTLEEKSAMQIDNSRR